jgi:tetraacyldisaccharide 4'-kinase
MNYKLSLLPLAAIFGSVVWLRNLFFKIGIFKRQKINGKSICIGNLSVGGTGKSPHTAYLIQQLQDKFNIAVLSRGYGRKTKGYLEVESNSLAQSVGDEPLMLKHRFEEKISVHVCEDRREGVQKIQKKQPAALIILDDAYQHQWIEAGLNIVLSTFVLPPHQDYLLPAGTLREPIQGLNRASALIFTKCPEFSTIDFAAFEKAYTKYKIPIFYSRYVYKELQPLTDLSPHTVKKVILVSAIAQPEPLKTAFDSSIEIFTFNYRDHYDYRHKDIQEIHQFFDTFAQDNVVLVTTAKDWVKIQPLLSPKDRVQYPWMLLDFKIEWSDEQAFNQFINAYVDAN